MSEPEHKTITEALEEVWEGADASEGNKYVADSALRELPLGEIANHLKARGVEYEEFVEYVHIQLESMQVPQGDLSKYTSAADMREGEEVLDQFDERSTE